MAPISRASLLCWPPHVQTGAMHRAHVPLHPASCHRRAAPMSVEAPGQRHESASSRCRVCSTLTITSRSGSRNGEMRPRLLRCSTCTYSGALFVYDLIAHTCARGGRRAARSRRLCDLGCRRAGAETAWAGVLLVQGSDSAGGRACTCAPATGPLRRRRRGACAGARPRAAPRPRPGRGARVLHRPACTRARPAQGARAGARRGGRARLEQDAQGPG